MDAIPRYRLLLTFAAYAGLVGLACAQPPGGRGGRGGPPGGGGMGMLLRSDEVRAELEILDEQQDQLRELEEEMRGEMREMFRGRRGDGERPDREAMRARFEELREKAESRVAEVLSTQQMERLKQINAQVQIDRGGARALMGGPLAEQLDLTDDQKKQLREKSQEIQAEMQKKMQAARAEAREQLMQILTSEQRAKLESITGEPFTMTQNGWGRGGRGRGGPGGRGGEGGRRGGRPGPPPPPPGDEL